MRTLEEVRQNCHISEDGHWLWRGSLRPDGRPNIWAPDIGRGHMSVQSGPRAIWQMATGRAVPKNWRAYGTCEHKECCNPECVRCTSERDFGRWLTKTGLFKSFVSRRIANQANGRKRSKMTPELIVQIQMSTETGVALSARLNIPTSCISKARRGGYASFNGASPFAGLGA